MKTATIIRMILLFVALINQGLVMAGFNTLPFTEEEVEKFLTYAFTAVMALYTWWKDNDITKKARERKAKIEEEE
jgi:SPP1 family holin